MSDNSAIPGTNVPVNSPVSPGGAQGLRGGAGPDGVNAFTTTTESYVVPEVGETVQVNVKDAAWIASGQMVWIETADPSQAVALRVIAKTADTITVTLPGPVLPPFWIPQTTPANYSWNGIAYGNGLFVAVAYSGTGNRVMTSPDGINWTLQNTPANYSWWSIAYGNGLFVAVAYSGVGQRVMTSPDGIDWTLQNTPADNYWQGVAYGNGLFVAVAASSIAAPERVMTSPDGINWTLQTTPIPANNWYAVTYGNGLFVAVAYSGTGNRVMTSPDGINWTSQTTPMPDNNWTAVTYGNGLFVAVASSGIGNRVMTSPDGVNWTLQSTPADNNWNGVAYGNGLFMAVAGNGTGNRSMTSPDAINWTWQPTSADRTWYGVAYGNGLFVTVASGGTGERIMTFGSLRVLIPAGALVSPGGPPTPSRVIGVTDGRVAAPGEVGQVINFEVWVTNQAPGSIPVILRTFQLPAGDWQFSGQVFFMGSAPNDMTGIRLFIKAAGVTLWNIYDNPLTVREYMVTIPALPYICSAQVDLVVEASVEMAAGTWSIGALNLAPSHRLYARRMR